MKKILLSFIHTALLPLALGAATKTVTWSLPADWAANVEYSQDAGYLAIHGADLDPISDPAGAPSVPYLNALIEVPANATLFAITASDEAWRTVGTQKPVPVREPVVVGEALGEPVEDAAAYASVWPSAAFEQGEKMELGGKTYLPVRVKAFRWNGPNGTLEALTSLRLSVTCTLPRATLKTATASVPSAKVDYIVVSPPAFVGYWQDFVDYRKTTHTNLTFAIVSTADIYKQYSGRDDALKLHHFIEAMYALGTRYILLGAGAQHTSYDQNTMIPTRFAITRNGQSQSCDYYYCVVEKPDGAQEVWDYNGDGIYLASANPNGGYYADATSQFSWTGAMMVHRFPARASISMGGKTKTAEEQIKGYVKKLKRAEQGLFAGRFCHAVHAATLSEKYNKYHGTTSADCTQERQFYDLGANIFSEEHGNVAALNEYETRERSPSYFTLKRPVGTTRSVLQYYYKNGETADDFYARDFDSMLINSHGSPEAVDPLTREGVWKSTGLSVFHILIVPCHAGNPCSGNNNVVSISEAGVVNPDGGSLVSYGNSNTGLWGGKDTLSEKIERDVVKMLYACQDGSYHNAGEARLWAMNSFKWNGLGPNSAGGLLMCDSMAYGDPLVKLSPIWSRTVDANGIWRRGDQAEASEPEYASTLTVNAGADDMTLEITNEVGAAWLNVNGAAGKTLTLKGSGKGHFKVTNKVTVNETAERSETAEGRMTLNWDVPGGFGRNGINFAGGGNLRIGAAGYYGIDFRNIGDLVVAPSSGTAILDFDSKNYFRNGDGYFKTLTVSGPGETIFRSRQAGIFTTNFTVNVTGGTLTLETPCVGGSGQQVSTVPLFRVKDATLAVRPNPHWSAECFSRRVAFENGTLASRYDKFYLGPNVSGYPGLDIALDGPDNVFAGPKAMRLNGQLRLHSTTGGTVNVTAELVNGNGTGALALGAGVTAKLAAVNTFSGGITVPSGARLVVDNVRGLGAGSVVVASGAVLQLNAMPLAGVKSVTLQSGAKLVLKASDGASYQMYSPAETSFSMAADVKVYDSANESKEMEGIVTPEGAYFISSEAKAWRGIPMTWSSASTAQAWEKKGTPTTYADGDTVIFKDVAGIGATTVYVSGEVKPGMVAFQNAATDYLFDGADAMITVGSMATSGKTRFEPSLKATTQISVGGPTTTADITTPALNVAGGGALNVYGTVTGVDTIRVIQFKITDTVGPHNTTPRESAPQMSELRFYRNGDYIFFPAGTTIQDSVGNAAEITGRSGNAYVFSEDSSSLKNLFDGSTTTYHQIGSSITGPWAITITFPDNSPIEMFTTFNYGRAANRTPTGDWRFLGAYPDANPRSWGMYAGNSEGSLEEVKSVSGRIDGTASSMTEEFSANWTPSSKAVVQDGGKLYLNGTYNLPMTVKAGATLAVTNDSKIYFAKAPTLSSETYSINVDATEAKKTNGFFQVTSGGGVSSVWQFATEPDVAVMVKDSNLWIATDGVRTPPYAAAIFGDGATASWNGMGWTANGAAFGSDWSSAITKQTGSGTLTVGGTNMTLDVDCGVALDTLAVVSPTNCHSGLLTVNAAGSGYANISALDFREYRGGVVWNPALANWGCNVYVGSNDVTVANMTGGTGLLQVSAGGHATVPQNFASYDVDKDALVRFTGTRSFDMANLPDRGILSFDNATLKGAFQKTLVTYLVKPGDNLVFTGDGNNYNARISSSFEISGGNVTINSNGASTWFGINGETSYRQTGGTFLCTANGTGTSGSGYGLLLGYSASMTEDFELSISNGSFLVPDSSINFFGPARFNLMTNALVRAKGVFRGSGNKGVVNVNEGATFEVGTIGLCADSCDFNLFGGTLAGFEDGAKTVGDINLVGYGTLAAADGTTLTVKGGIVADGATLNIGATNYAGTVKLSAIPAGITNVVVSAGTLNLGTYRPVTKTLVASGGAIAITLSNAQIMDAQTNAVRIIKAAAIPQGGVLVYNKRGHLQDDTVVEIVDGYLTVRTATTVQRVANAVWSNFGNATVGGIGTAMGNGNYNNFTANFGVADNIAIKEIGGEGMLKLRKIRFGQRDTKVNVPSGLKITQGAKVITSTGVSVSASNVDIVLYLKDYLSNNKQKYSFYSYTFTFADDALSLDCSEDFTFTFTDGNGAAMNAGIRAMQPANSKLAVGGYAPCVEVTGDWEYDLGNGLEDDVGGDSVSINVGGGAGSTPGKLITSASYAGVVPVLGANWNQDALQTATVKRDATLSPLVEVLADGSVMAGPMTARLLAKNTYSANGKSTTSTGDGELMFGYLDDGAGSGTGAGAGIYVENIPYSSYDVYVYMGSDQTTSSDSFGAVSVTAGGVTARYPAAGTSWGSAESTHGAVVLGEGTNYVRFAGCSGESLAVLGAVGAQPVRCGIAGIQIVNTGVRQEIYTWSGGGVWSEKAANWRAPEGGLVAWPGAGENLVAQFTNDASVQVEGEVIAPTVKFGKANEVRTFDGYVPTTSTKLFEGAKLSDVASFAGEMRGAYIDNPGEATACFASNDGMTATVQFQRVNNQLKCVKVELTQQGDDIYGRAVYAKWVASGSAGSTDFDAQGNVGSVVVADDGKGYGIKGLTISVKQKGMLTIANAGGLVGELTLANGELSIASGEMAADMTLCEGASLNVTRPSVGDAVVTSGALRGVAADFSNVTINGAAISTDDYEFVGGAFVLKRPMLADEDGMISVNPTNAAEYVVSTNNVKPQIMIGGAGDHTIVVPPAVTNVVGVAPEKIKVRHGEYDITAAFTKSGDAGAGVVFRLNRDGSVPIGGETIKVTPELSSVDGDEHVSEQPFAISDTQSAVGVKTIPGLTYRLMRGSEIGTYGHEADSAKASATRLTLKDAERPADKAFYVIEVESW